MPATDSTNFTAMRRLFTELSGNIQKLSALLFSIVTATNPEFIKQHKQTRFLVMSFVAYSFLVIIGTVAQIYKRSLMPFIICGMLIVGGLASVLALSIFSFTLSIITLPFWVALVSVFIYVYVVPLKNRAPLPNPVAVV
ncbi:hypothetical protein Fmac_018298 [Flemingia macrophylla]|uniref:Uncharacterized protein n=1 Tax=Flemingia macrophylla TaxID=520843 RepID=A0ABD1M4K2_9FABA